MDEKTIVYIVGGIIIILFALYIIKIKFKQKNNEQLHITKQQTVEAKDLFIQQQTNINKSIKEEISNLAHIKKPVTWLVSNGYEQDVEALKKQIIKVNPITKEHSQKNTNQPVDEGFFQTSTQIKNSEQPKEVIENPHLDGYNLLIVDDSFTVRKKLQNLLIKSGYNVILKNDGFDAVTYLQTNTKINPDLIITDIEMPKMNGFQFIDWLKQSNKHNNLPIMVISAHVELHLKLMESGTIDGFISKPFKDEDLLIQLEYLLSKN